MQLGRRNFVEAPMFVLTVAGTVTIATYLRSSALLWLLASCFVLCIADFPRNITIFVHQRSLSALLHQSSSGFPIFDGRLQDETNEGMKQLKDQLKPMKITQALTVCPATTVWSEMTEND